MIAKIIGGLIITGACTLVGIQISKELRGRVRVLEAWQTSLLQLENYISFTKTPLQEIYQLQSTLEYGVGEFFGRLAQKDVISAEPGALWKEQISGVRYMAKEDKDILLQMAAHLGKSETQTQINTIALAKSRLEQNLLFAKEMEKRDAKMYKTISFFAGVGIAILLC